MTVKKILIQILFTLIFSSAFCESYGKNNSEVENMFRKNSAEISQPDHEILRGKIYKLYSLSETEGTEKVVKKLKELIEKRSAGNVFLCRLLLEELASRKKSLFFDAGESWNLWGSFTRYGNRDIFCKLKGNESRNINKLIMPAHTGYLYPFADLERPDETVVLKKNFEHDKPLRVWISSNSSFILYVNGREVITGEGEDFLYKGVELMGTRNYTLEVRMKGRSRDSRIRIILTGIDDTPVKVRKAEWGSLNRFSMKRLGSVRSNTFTLEKIPGEEFYESGDYSLATRESEEYIKSSPGKFYSYEYLVKSLVKNRQKEKLKSVVSEYRKKFPKSGVINKWLCEAYGSGNSNEFVKCYKALPERYFQYILERQYINKLILSGKHDAAIKRMPFIKKHPGTGDLIISILERTGRHSELRRFLLKGAALTKRSIYYYRLGVTDLGRDLDPVPYWKIALRQRGIWPSLMKDIDIHENASPGNRYYLSRYLGEEYAIPGKWKSRSVTLHFLKGILFLEMEDRVPGDKIKNNKYDVGNFKNANVWYVLKVHKGRIKRIKFDYVNGKIKLGEPVVPGALYIFKHSAGFGKIFNGKVASYRSINILPENHDFFRLNLEVRTDSRSAGFQINRKNILEKNKGPENAVYSQSGEMNFSGKSKVDFDIYRFKNFEIFSKWYEGLVASSGKFKIKKEEPLEGDMKEKLRKARLGLLGKYKISGKADFNPRDIKSILKSNESSQEELLHLLREFLLSKGILSFFAFKVNFTDHSMPAIDNELFLYIPIDKEQGYYMNLKEDRIKKNLIDNVILFKNGFRTKR